MVDFFDNMAFVVFIFGLFIVSILFTLFLFSNERKLKRDKSLSERKKMYKNALFVSSFIIIVGALLYLLGINGGRMELLFFGWIVVSGGFIGCVYSLINWYKARST